MIRNTLLYILLLCSFYSYAQNTYVVSVGISDYKYINDLRKTETDAKNFAELYRTKTDNVETLLGQQATHDNVLNTIRTYFSKAKENDIVVFYFSGHGTNGGLCAYETKSAKTAITYAEIQQAIRNCKAGEKLLFIDACFSGGLRQTPKDASQSNKNLHSQLKKTKGIMLFLSSRTEETSQENIWAPNGFYTQYLLMGLKGEADTNGDRIVTAKEIFTYVSGKVTERTSKRQNPVMWGNFDDDMQIMNWNEIR